MARGHVPLRRMRSGAKLEQEAGGGGAAQHADPPHKHSAGLRGEDPRLQLSS